MNALGALILGIIVFVVLAGPRRWALLAIMAGVLYLPQGQQVQILGLNLFALRIIELFGFARIVSRREFAFSGLNKLDRNLLFLYLYTTVIFLIRSNVDQTYQVGLAVDAYLCYFIFRGLIANIEDLKGFLKIFPVVLAPYTAIVLVEHATHHNPFAVLGGADAGWLRDGKLRCYGSFRNPSILGTLGASFLPLYISLLLTKSHRLLGIIGVGLSLAIVWASNSGAPASCVGVVIVGWGCWKVRAHMQKIRRGLGLGLVVLAFVMKAPIWYLPARMSDLTGGDGYHRSHLMDMAFQTLDKWWLVGMPVTETHDWFAYSLDTGAADMTNEYLLFGITSGLLAMALFIFLFVVAFKYLGTAIRSLRAKGTKFHEEELLFWGLGVTLAMHSINYLSITYFDQSYALWFFVLGAISSLSGIYLGTGKFPQDIPQKTAAAPHAIRSFSKVTW